MYLNNGKTFVKNNIIIIPIIHIIRIGIATLNNNVKWIYLWKTYGSAHVSLYICHPFGLRNSLKAMLFVVQSL